MTTYYKIAPEWAEKLQVTLNAPRHPDGWYIIVHEAAARLARILGTREDGTERTPEEAVRETGGQVYTLEQALASQRGEAAYMMDTGHVQPENDMEE